MTRKPLFVVVVLLLLPASVSVSQPPEIGKFAGVILDAFPGPGSNYILHEDGQIWRRRIVPCDDPSLWVPHDFLNGDSPFIAFNRHPTSGTYYATTEQGQMWTTLSITEVPWVQCGYIGGFTGVITTFAASDDTGWYAAVTSTGEYWVTSDGCSGWIMCGVIGGGTTGLPDSGPLMTPSTWGSVKNRYK